MLCAVIILIIITVVLLFLLFLKSSEIDSIKNQLHEIGSKNTNTLIRSENGMANKLIYEINCLLKEMRRSKIEYNQKNRALDRMMTNISHDLRTPLTSAMGYISLLRNSDLSEEEKCRELEIVENRLLRLEELIDSFFEFSQIVSSGKEPEKKELNFVSVIEESIAHYFDDYNTQNRKINFHCDKNKIIVNSNYNMLMRIFDNLIGNALKHGKGDLTISVIVSDNIRITFSNELLSSEINAERVFDEFYTTDISRTKGNTGLGLAIAKQFTEMLSGTIKAELTEGLFEIIINF